MKTEIVGYLLLATTAISAQESVLPPIEQSTADCANPVYASDQLLCNDVELRQLDARLKTALRQTSNKPTGLFVESDGVWFKRRSRCAFEAEHKQCLGEAYAERIKILDTINEGFSSAKIAKCRGLDQVRTVSLGNSTNGQMIVQASPGQFIGVASLKSVYRVWKPAVSYTKSRTLLTFESHDGASFSCRVQYTRPRTLPPRPPLH